MSASYAGGGFFLVFIGIILLVIAFWLYNRNATGTTLTAQDNTTAYIIGGVGIFFIFIGIIVGLYGLYEYSNNSGEKDDVKSLKKKKEELDAKCIKEKDNLKKRIDAATLALERQGRELYELRTQAIADNSAQQKINEAAYNPHIADFNQNQARKLQPVYSSNPRRVVRTRGAPTYIGPAVQPAYK